jgi:Domain of unknown function (DUF4224)
MILTPEELELLTGKTERAQKRYGSQAVVLTHLGIPFLLRPDKTLIVYRRHADAQRPTENEDATAPAVLL